MGDDLILDAEDASLIDAKVVAVSAAVGAGAGAAGISIGAAVSRNLIGYTLTGSKLPAAVKAYIEDSSVTAEGDLSATAYEHALIDAGIGAGSAAVAAGGIGLAGAGTGASAENRVSTDVKAYIDGDGSEGVEADTVTLSAHDVSTINAKVAAASLAAAITGGGGAAVSVGVSLATNRIDNAVEAYIANADVGVTTTVGAVSLDAIEEANIDAVSVAASLAIGGGSGFGGGVSGAGAHAQNVILGKTEAYISASVVDSAGAVDIDASNTSDIDAKIIAASGAGGGGAAAGAAAIGVSLAENLIGWNLDASTPATYTTSDNPSQVLTNQTVKITSGAGAGRVYKYIGSSPYVKGGSSTGNGGDGYLARADFADTTKWRRVDLDPSGGAVRAYTANSSIDADGALTLDAISDQTIDATVVSASVAIAGGLVGGTAAGAGSRSENRIAMTVEASIDGDGATGIEASSIRLNADDTSRITADTASASLAVTIAPAGIAVAIAASDALNDIGNTVIAAITNADTQVKARSGAVELIADEGATINALSVAAAAGGASLGGAAGGGAKAVNTITSSIEAKIADDSVVNATGNVKVSATDSSTITANLPAVAVSVGVVALSGAVSYTRNLIGTTIDAEITNANVTSTAGACWFRRTRRQPRRPRRSLWRWPQASARPRRLPRRAWRSGATHRHSSVRALM